MSSFKGIDLFGSGPNRFSVEALGTYVLRLARIDPFAAGSAPIGPLEEAVVVRGRLVAQDEAGLWALRDAIVAQLTDPPQEGKLEDGHGREWEGMSFVLFDPGDRTDRGRVVSLGYTARFIRFLGD